eukprot:6475529-Amphidinium_carterae.1
MTNRSSEFFLYWGLPSLNHGVLQVALVRGPGESQNFQQLASAGTTHVVMLRKPVKETVAAKLGVSSSQAPVPVRSLEAGESPKPVSGSSLHPFDVLHCHILSGKRWQEKTGGVGHPEHQFGTATALYASLAKLWQRCSTRTHLSCQHLARHANTNERTRIAQPLGLSVPCTAHENAEAQRSMKWEGVRGSIRGGSIGWEPP